MSNKKEFNAGEAAIFLGIARTYFFAVQRKYKLKYFKKYGNVKLYTLKDLSEIKKKMR